MKTPKQEEKEEQKPKSEKEKPNAVVEGEVLKEKEPEEKKRMLGWLFNKIKRDELKAGDHIYSWRHYYLYSHHGIYVGDDIVIHFTQSGEREIGTGTVLDSITFSSSPSGLSDIPCPRCGDQSKSSGVISSCLECFLNGGELYLFQYGVSRAVFLAKIRGGTCTTAASDPAGDVIHRTRFLLQNGFGGYDIFKNNCEDFAIYCKTGLLVSKSGSFGRSGQASSFVVFADSVVLSPLRFMTTRFPGLATMITRVPGLAATATSFPGQAVFACGYYSYTRLSSDIGIRSDVTKVPVERLFSCSGLDKSNPTSETRTTNASEKTKKD